MNAEQKQNQHREDGRLLDTLRTQQCELNTITRSTSSCSWESDFTRCVASIQGPREIQSNKENGEMLVIDAYYRDGGLSSSSSGNNNSNSNSNRSMEYFIKQLCQSVLDLRKNPSLGMTVSVQTLNDDGSLLSAIINSIGMALVESGVETKGLMCGATCAIRKEDGKMVLDPTKQEENESRATMTCAFLINPKTVDKTIVLAMKTKGKMTETEVFDGLALCRDAATSVMEYFQATMRAEDEKDAALNPFSPSNLNAWKEAFEGVAATTTE